MKTALLWKFILFQFVFNLNVFQTPNDFCERLPDVCPAHAQEVQQPLEDVAAVSKIQDFLMINL